MLVAISRLMTGMRGRYPRLAGCRQGATAVEFGIVAPIFLLLMLGMFEMSRAMWIKATLQFAVEEATRSFLVDNTLTTTQVASAAETACTGTGMSTDICTGAFSATQTTSGTIDIMKVTATYNFQTLVASIQTGSQTFFAIPDITLTAASAVPLNS